tara:strand:- start:537 stop:824 length:288 start_codon:yes stop_codon:yes gene_type:complete
MLIKYHWMVSILKVRQTFDLLFIQGVGAGAHNESVQLTKIVDSVVGGISTGKDHSIYCTTNGEVYVFGSNSDGQLGLPGRTILTHEKQLLYDPNQ